VAPLIFESLPFLGPWLWRSARFIELVCASSLFTWAGTLNTVVHVATGADSRYGERGAYAIAS